MKRLLLTFLLFIGISFSQGINTSVIYLIENYDFEQITTDSINVDKLKITHATSTDVLALPVYVSETLSGTFGASAPAYGMTVYSKILGANLSATDAYEAAITGLYGITGTNASVYPKAGVLGWIADNTTTADGAFIALIDGDTQVTQAGAAFGVRHLNSTATSGFDYGLDLYGAAIGAYDAVSYRTADIRGVNQETLDNATDGSWRVIGDFIIGAASPDDVQPTFSILGDADSDAGDDVSETLSLVLTPNADPTLATWDFASTQSAGYTFDKSIGLSSGTTINEFSTDTGLTGDSDDAVPTEKAVKAYADAIAAAGSDDQKIDVLSGAGNTISISLESDGEADKTLDISGFTAIAANTAKNTNVPTALSVGTVNTTTVAITSDGGADDVVLPASTVSTAGMFTTAKWAEVVDNNAKNTNVSTALSIGTVNATTYGITSDGSADDIILPEATTTVAGLLGADKWDEIVVNTSLLNVTPGTATASKALIVNASKDIDLDGGDLTATDIIAEGVLSVGGDLIVTGDQTLYGEMESHESNNTLTIAITMQDYGIQGEASAGQLNGFTFVSGSTGPIASITTVAAGDSTNYTDVGHGLLTGDYVTINTVNHSGIAEVVKEDNDNFRTGINFVSDETGFWFEGDYLLASAGTAGQFLGFMSMSFSAGNPTKEYHIHTVQNDAHIDGMSIVETVVGTNHSKGADSAIITITAGDRFWMVVENETDTEDLDYEDLTLLFHKL